MALVLYLSLYSSTIDEGGGGGGMPVKLVEPGAVN